MSTPYGISGATFWLNLGTPNDAFAQNANGTAGYDISSTVATNAGGSLALAGQSVYQATDSISGSNLAQQTSATSQPIFMPFGGTGQGDGSAACIKFPNYVTLSGQPGTPGSLREQVGTGGSSSSFFLNLPSSCAAFNGTPKGEATIFIAGRFGLLAGGPFLIGGNSASHVGLSINQAGPTSPTAPALSYLWRSGSTNKISALSGAMLWPNMQPCVMCLRFAVSSGVVAANQTDFWIGNNYREQDSFNNLSGYTSATGGYLGSTNGSSQSLDCEINEFLVYNQALSDAQVEQIIQTMQDKWCGGFDNQAFVLFFGDSRTRGNNAQLNANQSYPSPFDASARSWPKRCLSQLGGAATGLSQARVGDSVTDQYAMFNTSYSSQGTYPHYASIIANACGGGAANVLYNSVACIGEIGINDIYFNAQSASQVIANLTTLYTAMASTGALGSIPVSVIAMTIVPPAVGTVFNGTTFTSTMNTTVATVNAWIKNTAPSLIPGLIPCDNAADPRWANSSYMGSDGLHPDDPGFGVYAQNAAKTLAKALGLSAAPGSVGLTFGNFPAGGRSLTYGSFR